MIAALRRQAVRWLHFPGPLARPVAEERAFLAAQQASVAAAPPDDLERAWLQYRCHRFLRGPWRSLILDLAALAMLPGVFAAGLLRAAPLRPRCTGAHILMPPVQTDWLPEDWRDGAVQAVRGFMLTAVDLRRLAGVWRRHPASPWFLLRLAMATGRARAALAPGARSLVSSCEYGFYGSWLTAWCEAEGIRHVNVMHGEKLWFIREAWVRFHVHVVWDERYIEIFRDLHAESDRWVVAWPAALRCPDVSRPPAGKDILLVCLQEFRTSEAAAGRVLAAHLRTLASRWQIVVRPHPRYTDPAVVADVFGGFVRQDPAQTPFCSALAECAAVCAAYSTVLAQAAFAGRTPVIDDVSDPGLVSCLRERRFVMLDRSHKRLSSLGEPESLNVTA